VSKNRSVDQFTIVGSLNGKRHELDLERLLVHRIVLFSRLEANPSNPLLQSCLTPWSVLNLGVIGRRIVHYQSWYRIRTGRLQGGILHAV